MNELVKAAVKTLIETVFQVVTSSGTTEDKIARLERATAALVSEKTSDELIRQGLKL